MSSVIPESLRREHDEIRAELLAASKVGGDIGDAAQRALAILECHFEKEDSFALPPLAALAPLARGESVGDMAGIARLSQRLREELPALLADHQAIVTALQQLVAAARRSGKEQWVWFATKAMQHARMEEELLYPAALLVGEHIRQRIADAID